MNSDKNFNCRVCGCAQGFEPWGEDGETCSFEICDCCGVQFRYQDCTELAMRKFRREWLDKGAKWRSPELKPEG